MLPNVVASVFDAQRNFLLSFHSLSELSGRCFPNHTGAPKIVQPEQFWQLKAFSLLDSIHVVAILLNSWFAFRLVPVSNSGTDEPVLEVAGGITRRHV